MRHILLENTSGIIKSSLILLVFSVFFLYWSWHGGIIGLVGDDAIYLMMADNLSFYKDNPSADFLIQHTRFPPFFPALLALFGAGSQTIGIAFMVTSSCLGLAMLIFYNWLIDNEINSTYAFLTVLIFALLPTSLTFAINLWSEHCYLLLSLLIIWQVEKAKSDAQWLMISLLIGIATLTRSVSITLVLAYFLILFIQRHPKRWILVFIAVLPMLLWSIVALFHEAEESYADLLQMRYANGFIKGLLWQLQTNSQGFWTAWHSSFNPMSYHPGLAGLLLIIAILALIKRLFLLKFDAFYVIIYILIIFLWPHTDHANRFLWVLLPIIMMQTILLLKAYPLKLKWGYLMIIATLALPASAMMISRHTVILSNNAQRTAVWINQTSAEQALANLNMVKKIEHAFRTAQAYIDEGECVYNIHPEWFMFNARRFAIAPPFAEIPDNLFKQRMQHCNYAYILWVNSHPYFSAGYPVSRIKAKIVVVYRLSNKTDAPILGALYRLHQ